MAHVYGKELKSQLKPKKKVAWITVRNIWGTRVLVPQMLPTDKDKYFPNTEPLSEILGLLKCTLELTCLIMISLGSCFVLGSAFNQNPTKLQFVWPVN